MSSNAFGTALRIFGIFCIVILFWFVLTNFFYFLAILFFDMTFSWSVAFSIFAIFVLFRSFYPKNVFRG